MLNISFKYTSLIVATTVAKTVGIIATFMCICLSLAFAEQAPLSSTTPSNHDDAQQIATSADTLTETVPTQTMVDAVEEQKYYQIDLVLFEHKNNSGTQSEFWSQIQDKDISPEFETQILDEKQVLSNSGLPFKSTTTTADTTTRFNRNIYNRLASFSLLTQKFSIFDNDFIPLAREQYLLQEEYTRIRQSSHYTALAYLGWIQPGLSREDAKPIEIKRKNLTGSIKIILSRYLHTHIDLLSTREICTGVKSINTQDKVTDSKAETAYDPNKPDNAKLEPKAQGIENSVEISIDSQAQEFTCAQQDILFQQSRKMRSREIHYIDNPAMGILILITPVEKAENQPSEAQAPSIQSEQPVSEPAPEKHKLSPQQRQIDIESAAMIRSQTFNPV